MKTIMIPVIAAMLFAGLLATGNALHELYAFKQLGSRYTGEQGKAVEERVSKIEGRIEACGDRIATLEQRLNNAGW